MRVACRLAQARAGLLGAKAFERTWGEKVGSGDGAMAGGVARVRRQQQHAAADHGVRRRFVERDRPIERPRPKPRGLAKTGVKAWGDQRRRIARAAGPWRGGFDHHRRCAQRAHRPSGGRAGDATADDRHPGSRRVRWRSAEPPLKPFALAPEAGPLVDLEACLRQASADRAGHCEGCDPRPRRGVSAHLGHDVVAPHGGVPRGRKAVEKPGVGLTVPAGQRRGDVANHEVEDGAILRELDTVDAGRLAWPARAKPRRHGREFRPGGQCAGGLRGGDRKALNGEDMQLALGGAGARPELEEGCDIEARAKPQLAHHKAPATRPRLGQAAARQEHRPAFGEPVVRREIDVVEHPRPGSGLGPVQVS